MEPRWPGASLWRHGDKREHSPAQSLGPWARPSNPLSCFNLQVGAGNRWRTRICPTISTTSEIDALHVSEGDLVAAVEGNVSVRVLAQHYVVSILRDDAATRQLECPVGTEYARGADPV